MFPDFVRHPSLRLRVLAPAALFVVGKFIVDRQTGKPSLPFAFPIVDETGNATRGAALHLVIKVDRGQLEQVILNLAVNARAMPFTPERLANKIVEVLG